MAAMVLHTDTDIVKQPRWESGVAGIADHVCSEGSSPNENTSNEGARVGGTQGARIDVQQVFDVQAGFVADGSGSGTPVHHRVLYKSAMIPIN